MKFTNLNAQLSHMNRSMTERNFIGARHLVGFDGSAIKEPLEARFYCTNTGTVHCALWLHITDPDKWGFGTGSAPGAGYDKESAALQEACVKAGVVFESSAEHFHAAGMTTAMDILRQALEAELGYQLKEIYAYA